MDHLNILAGFARTLRLFLGFFGSYIAPFGARRGFKMILSHMAPSCFNMSSYRAIWTHFRQISMIFEQINMHAPLAMFLVGRHNLQTPHPSCMLLAQPAACTGLPCVVHSFWLCLIFCARYSFNSILEAPNLWVRCSRLFFPQNKGPQIFGSP